MGPWFERNDIQPIFLVWRTSILESISQIGEDLVGPFVDERDALRSRSLGTAMDRLGDKLQDKFDKAFETVAEQTVGKAIWSQMKRNAGAAATGRGGTRQLVTLLRALCNQR